MSDLSDEFTIYNLIRCEFNPDDCHIINEPRSLPCGNSACYSCIEKALFDGQIYCKFCDQPHSLNLKELPRLLPLERAVDTHVVRLTKYLIAKSKEITNSLAESFENRENQLRKLFQGVQKDIKKRIETMKSQLDELQTVLFDACDNLKIKINTDLIELEKLAERLHSEKFIKEAQKLLDKNESNLEKLKKNMHSCEYNFKKLKKVHANYTKTMENLSFKPNLKWLPSADDIGSVGNLVDTQKLIQELEEILDREEDSKIRLKFKQKNEINEIKLNFKPYATCELKNGDLAVTNFDKHKLVVLKNDTHEVLKEITGAENIPLKYPSGLCCDDTKDHVYLCDQYNHRVIILDSTIDSLINIIKDGLMNPIDVRFNSNHLYILDFGNKLIKEFNKDGELNRSFILNDQSSDTLSAPRQQAISNEEIAVTDSFDKIFIYDKSNNRLLQTIDADFEARFMSIYYLDNTYLFLHEIKTRDDQIVNSFICYEKFESLDHSDDEYLCWKETHHREIELLNNITAPSYSMSKVGDRFAICLHDKKKILLI